MYSPNAKLFEDSLTPLMEQLLQNNPSSHNISSLVGLWEDKCQELRSLGEKDERSVTVRRLHCVTHFVASLPQATRSSDRGT